MEENNILIIGNGFDLYHDLKTRYIDFISYLNENKTNEIGTNSFVKYFCEVYSMRVRDDVTWIDCENEIGKIISFFQSVTDKKVIIQKKKGSLDEEKFDFFGEKKIITNTFERYIHYTPNTYKIQPEYLIDYSKESAAACDEEKILNIEKLIGDLINELKEFIKILELYLSKQEKESSINKLCTQLSIKTFSYVINFNYTHTYRLYNIRDEEVLFVHGEINHNPNNMVLGFEDDNLGVDYIWFQKYFQRIQKHIEAIDSSRFNRLIKYNSKYEKIQAISTINEALTVAYIFGHSLGCSDGDMITRIVDMSDKVIIYWYDDGDYEMKLKNLFAVLKKERALNMIENGKISFEKIADLE